ncbi:hypothetical protein LTR53_005997 [Teratosphaeriaceae sp. CCFEE 6253]|nr:hypothetical protein LTR53_005997 [Teratosphaeriaceae sp. CCFEE 6253]
MPTDRDGNKNCSNMTGKASIEANARHALPTHNIEKADTLPLGSYCSNCTDCSGLSHASNEDGVHKDSLPDYSSSSSEDDGEKYLQTQGK